jgi:hypothetical protein
MSDLLSILQNHYPAGGDINVHLPDMANNHLEEVLADLPHIEALPMPNELGTLEAFAEKCPLVIEEAISIASLKRHLSEASPETPEIGIIMFKDGTQALELGTTERVRFNLAWWAFQKRGTIDFHTHPDPVESEHMRLPSLGDIDWSISLGLPITIGSRDGLTHVPRPEVVDLSEHTGLTLWRKYVADRGFDEEDFESYGPRKIYTEFITDIIQPRFSAWDTLDNETSLADVISLLRKQ